MRLCGVDHRQKRRCVRGPSWGFHEVRRVRAGTFTKIRLGMPAPGIRLFAVGGGCSKSQRAIAHGSDGPGLVRAGGFWAERKRPRCPCRLQDAADMTTNGKRFPHAVLIVEDDQLLKLLTVDIVEGAGFVAIQADNADEAVAILEVRSDIALLLTDIDMPGSMDGLKLAHVVQNRWPPIKIIVVSSRVPDCDLPTDSRFFEKPYHAENLISEIRSMIAA